MTPAAPPRAADSTAPLQRTDVSALLALDSTPARLLVALFVLSNAIFTVATADVLIRPWPSYVAVLLVSAAGVLLVRPSPDPFPRRDTVIVLAVVAASTVLVASSLPDSQDLGRATWHLGSNTWLLFFLALRRRAWFAWLGMAIMTGITAEWAVRLGRSAIDGVLSVQTHVGILLVATLFAIILRRTSARINALNERSLDSAARTARIDAGEEIRLARVGELAGTAVPLLERIAAGIDFDEESRREFARAEAALRDGVRGRSLMVPAIQAAVDQARARGLTVTVLDDRGALSVDGAVVERVVSTVVQRLDQATEGTVTVRLLPAGRDALLTVVAATDDDVSRTTLGPDGRETTAAS